MRKKCTNSSCRRTFTVEPVNKVSCPYCGREYPRLLPGSDRTVVLLNPGYSRLGVIKLARKYTGLGFKDAKKLVDSAPSIVKTGLTSLQARQICKELREAGATAEAKKLANREAWCYYTAQAAGKTSR
jgi:ribosomal protein L7/L12